MIIDFHTHIFPDKIAKSTLDLLSDKAGILPFSDGTVTGLTKKMNEAGADVCVTLPVLTNPAQFDGVNRYASEINRAFEGNEKRLISFGGIHPLCEDIDGKMKQLKEMGFLGIKLHPEFQNFFIDSPESLRILRCAERLGLLVLLHTGKDVGIPPPVHCAPERLRGVLDHISGHNVIAAQLGGFWQWEEVMEQLIDTPYYFDTAVVAEFLDAETARQIILAHGADRVLMGSDSPWGDQKKAVDYIRGMGLSPEDEENILGGNARRLLGL